MRLPVAAIAAVLLYAPFESQAQTSTAPPPPPQLQINPDRPGLANGSFVVPKGHFQLEIGLDWEKHDGPGGIDRRFLIPETIRFGATSNFEVRMDTNGGFLISTGGSTKLGYMPRSYGFKWQFQQPVSARIPSLALMGHITPPTGSAGFESKVWQGDLSLNGDFDLVPGGRFEINPNVGFFWNDNGAGGTYRSTDYAMTVNYNPSSNVNWFIDCGGNQPEAESGPQGLVVDAGYAWIVKGVTQYDVSIGQRVSGIAGAHPFVMVGYSILF